MTVPVLTTTLVAAVAALAARNWWLARSERERAQARVDALSAALDDPSPTADASRSLFTSESAPRRVTSFAAAGAAMGILGVVLLLWAIDRPTTRDTVTVHASISPRLELLATEHVLDGETLVITGLVRNPSSSPTPALTVVATAIGHDGQTVGRGTSRLEPAVLAAGKETSFRVTVSDVKDLERYRLGFSNGHALVRHVDRRADVMHTALATAEGGN
jgi:hypothetical protein